MYIWAVNFEIIKRKLFYTYKIKNGKPIKNEKDLSFGIHKQ